VDSNLVLVKLDVAQCESESFTRPKSSKQHERCESKVSPCLETCEEASEFFAVERLDEAARHLDAEMRMGLPKALGIAEPDRPAERRSGLVTHAAGRWQGVPGVELIHASQGQQPQVNGPWSGGPLLLLVEKPDEFEEMNLGEFFQAEAVASHPDARAPECEGVGAKGGAGQAAEGTGIEERVCRFDLSAFGVDESAGRRISSIGVQNDHDVAWIWAIAILHRNCFKSSRIGWSSGCGGRLREEATADNA